MPYLLIDDGFSENQKITTLSDKAFRLHVHALVYCARNLTDGLISELALRLLTPNSTISRPIRVVKDLVKAGLWDETEGGWQIHDYLHYNPSRLQMEEKRARARERKRKHLAKGNAVKNGVPNGVTHAVQDPPKGVSKETPRGTSPTGSTGKTKLARGATGTRSTAPPPKQTTPQPDIETAPPPPELLEMFRMTPPRTTLPAEPDIDEQDKALIDYYAGLEPDLEPNQDTAT